MTPELFYNIPFALALPFVAILGLVLGSFATALNARVPKQKSWWNLTERSACPKCHAKLEFADLVPLVSWLLAKGKCRHCGAPVSHSYPLIELSSMLACVVAYLALGLSVHSVLIMLSVPFLIALFLIDLRTMLLPNQLLLSLAVLAAFDMIVRLWPINAFSLYPLLLQLVSAFLFAFFVYATAFLTKWVIKKQALGMGDVKFFFVAGLWLSPALLPEFAVISGLLGLVMAFAWNRWGHKNRGGVFPFGPALIVALYIMLVFDVSFSPFFHVL